MKPRQDANALMMIQNFITAKKKDCFGYSDVYLKHLQFQLAELPAIHEYLCSPIAGICLEVTTNLE
jgi:hypothetical protein